MASLTQREAAVGVVRRLREHGHIAYLAGGCVRDMLLGREPKDYDVATSATPDRIIELFRRTRRVGAQFGVVLVRKGGYWIETATFRTDLSYSDGRRPDAIAFSTPEEDARRRDFTINGMFYDPIESRVIDFVGGRADLESRTLRAIGEPRHRFREDHLRVLRAVRFAAVYECTIEPATWAAICEMAPSIRTVSAERIREELERSLAGPHRVRALRLLVDGGLLGHLWEGAVWTEAQVRRALAIVPHLPEGAAFEQVLAAMLLDRTPEEAGRICQSLRMSNASRDRVVWLVRHQADLCEPSALSLCDLKLLMQSGWFDDLTAQFRAACLAEGRAADACEEVRARAGAIPPEAVRPPPLVCGDDLHAMGLPQGALYGRILEEVYRAQLDERVRTRDEAVTMARSLVQRALGKAP